MPDKYHSPISLAVPDDGVAGLENAAEVSAGEEGRVVPAKVARPRYLHVGQHVLQAPAAAPSRGTATLAPGWLRHPHGASDGAACLATRRAQRLDVQHGELDLVLGGAQRREGAAPVHRGADLDHWRYGRATQRGRARPKHSALRPSLRSRQGDSAYPAGSADRQSAASCRRGRTRRSGCDAHARTRWTPLAALVRRRSASMRTPRARTSRGRASSAA